MNEIEWRSVRQRWTSGIIASTVPPQASRDVAMLIAHIDAQNKMILTLRRESEAATHTLQALCKSVGVIELPYALVESLHPKDELIAMDIQTEHGPMRRYTFKPFELTLVV